MAKVFNFVKKVGTKVVEKVKENPSNALATMVLGGTAICGLLYGAGSNGITKYYKAKNASLEDENTRLKCKIEETGNRFYDHLVSTGCTDKEALDKLNGIVFRLD